MLNQDPLRAFQKLSCPCGADVRVDPLLQERNVDCPKCGLPLSFVVTVDPQNRKRSKVSVIVPLSSMKTEGESLGTIIRKAPLAARSTAPAGKTVAPKAVGPKTVGPKSVARKAAPPPLPPAPPRPPVSTRSAGKTIRGVRAECPCGATFPVDESELTSMQNCPGCDVLYRIVVKIERGTRKKTVMLVPEKPLR